MQDLTDNHYILLFIGMTGSALFAIAFILLQARNRNKIMRQRQELHRMELAHQRDLLQASILSQEEERTRIGMDLHDEVGTVLSSLRMTIDDFVRKTSWLTEAHPFHTHCKQTIDKAIRDVRNISHDLSPFSGQAYRFIDAIEDLCTAVQRSGSLTLTLEYPGEHLFASLPRTAALALYRVIAELINNTIRHAEAHHIHLAFLQAPSFLRIDYRDDGKGLELNASGNGMGLRNIESRLGIIGATYTIHSSAGSGYNVQILAPYPSEPPHTEPKPIV